MIFSKANLSVVEVTKTDKAIPELDNVHFRMDGSTVGTNGMAVIAVGPVQKKMRDMVPLENKKMFTDETIYAETVKEVLKNMPRDTVFKGVLDHCDYANGKFSLTDGKRNRTIAAQTYPLDYVQYKAVYERAGCSKVNVKVAINLRRLIDMLTTINKTCPDSGKNQIAYLEFTDNHDIIVRSQNAATGQRVCGVFKAYSGAEGAWMERDEWEGQLFSSSETDKKKIKKVHKIKKVKKG